MGGPGSERDVSIASGKGICESLKEAGFSQVSELIINDDSPKIPQGTQLCYNIIHGTFGEDGQLQRYLEDHGYAYTGAGISCSENCFDKVLSKRIMHAAAVPAPRDQIMTRAQVASGELPHITAPCVVKPPREGSSVGVHIIYKDEQLPAALADVASYGEEILIEEYIKGKELTVAILDGVAMPVVHIIPRDGYYDMRNKYPALYGGSGSDYVCPAELSDEQTATVQAAAIKAYKALKVEVYGRVDVLLTDDGRPYVLEINTIPGMTASSLLPKSAAAAGISYAQLCCRIAKISLKQARGI